MTSGAPSYLVFSIKRKGQQVRPTEPKIFLADKWKLIIYLFLNRFLSRFVLFFQAKLASFFFFSMLFFFEISAIKVHIFPPFPCVPSQLPVRYPISFRKKVNTGILTDIFSIIIKRFRRRATGSFVCRSSSNPHVFFSPRTDKNCFSQGTSNNFFLTFSHLWRLKKKTGVRVKQRTFSEKVTEKSKVRRFLFLISLSAYQLVLLYWLRQT